MNGARSSWSKAIKTDANAKQKESGVAWEAGGWLANAVIPSRPTGLHEIGRLKIGMLKNR
jgi:hypothetical protein